VLPADIAQALRDHATREERSLYRVADAELGGTGRHPLRDALREILSLRPRERPEEPTDQAAFWSQRGPRSWS
jgi:hypothetical protein